MGQSMLLPLHASAASQSPAAERHTVPATLKRSQIGEVPLHTADMSHELTAM